MVIETSNKEQKKNKTVLLFSGGMDCLCVNYLFKPDVLLHIDYGGKYSKQEKESIKKLIEVGAIDKDKLIEIDIGDWLGKMERDDLIIPDRNVYLVTLAARYGERIYLASVAGDRSFDKDKEFYDKMSLLLSHTNNKQHWSERRQIIVTSPVKDITKNQMLHTFLERGGNPKWLLESYSCYAGEDKPCGLCKPCLRKAIALHINKIYVPNDYFSNNPTRNSEIIRLKDKIIRGKYRGEEDKDICLFMGWKYKKE